MLNEKDRDNIQEEDESGQNDPMNVSEKLDMLIAQNNQLQERLDAETEARQAAENRARASQSNYDRLNARINSKKTQEPKRKDGEAPEEDIEEIAVQVAIENKVLKELQGRDLTYEEVTAAYDITVFRDPQTLVLALDNLENKKLLRKLQESKKELEPEPEPKSKIDSGGRTIMKEDTRNRDEGFDKVYENARKQAINPAARDAARIKLIDASLDDTRKVIVTKKIKE